jgi:hypothetical protein
MTLSGLARLPICIALIAFSFAGCFVLQNTLNTGFVSELARLGFSFGCGCNGSVSCCCFRGDAISFIKLYLLALGTALVTSFCD